MEQAGSEEELTRAEEEMDTDSSVESGTSRISFRIRVTPDTRKKQVSVLMLTPQWRFDDYGMATITRSMVQNLRMIDPKDFFIRIACTVLEENGKISRDQIEDADKLKVQLVGYSRPRGDRRKPDLDWLDTSVAMYYSHLRLGYDFIIGHAPYLTNGCLNLKDIFTKRGVNCTAILVVHKLPRKGNGEEDEEQLHGLSDADILLYMEKSTHEGLLHGVLPPDKEAAPDFKMYLPTFPTELFEVQHQKTKNRVPTKICLMTKEKKHLKVDGLDITLAANSIAQANKMMNVEMTATILTEKSAWYHEVEGNFQCDVIDEIADLKYHMRKSELFLLPLRGSSPLYGTEALSAIASGVPVIVPSDSAVGSLLLEMGANSSVIAGTDVKTWADEIIHKLLNPDESQQKASRLRNHLLEETTIATTHRDFINTIGEPACSELEVEVDTDSEIPQDTIDTARKFGVKLSEDPTDPKSYIIAFLKHLLLQREKLEYLVKDNYLNPDLAVWWQALLSLLEEENRRLLQVESGSIIFKLFCPTEESFQQLSDKIWRTRVVDRLQGLFKSLGLKKFGKNTEDSERFIPESSSVNHISALLLTTRWLFDFANITSVTRSIVNTLRCQDPDGTKISITCAVLELDSKVDQIEDAEAQYVKLRGAILPHNVEKGVPQISWMNNFSAAYYQHLVNENSFNFIIGHAPLLSFGAANLKAICKGQIPPKVVLMVHRLPKTEKGLLNKDLLCAWLKGADIVFSIGETDSHVLKRFLHGKTHEIYIPIYPLKHSQSLSRSESAVPIKPEEMALELRVLVGRKATEYNGTDIKLVVASVAQAVKQAIFRDSKVKADLTFLGEESADEIELKTSFIKILLQQNIGEDILNFHFLSKEEATGSNATLTCMKENTLLLFVIRKNYSEFGLEALTAALAGVPILVSENTGLAALLSDMGADEHSVVRQREYFDANVRAWADRILEKILQPSEARKQANTLRECLLQSVPIATTHSKFISLITETAAHPFSVECYVQDNYKETTENEIKKIHSTEMAAVSKAKQMRRLTGAVLVSKYKIRKLGSKRRRKKEHEENITVL